MPYVHPHSYCGTHNRPFTLSGLFGWDAMQYWESIIYLWLEVLPHFPRSSEPEKLTWNTVDYAKEWRISVYWTWVKWLSERAFSMLRKINTDHLFSFAQWTIISLMCVWLNTEECCLNVEMDIKLLKHCKQETNYSPYWLQGLVARTSGRWLSEWVKTLPDLSCFPLLLSPPPVMGTFATSGRGGRCSAKFR